MIFNDEYLYYDKKEDQLLIKIYSQGMIGHYYILGENEDGIEITYYPNMFDYSFLFKEPNRYEFIDTLQERESTIKHRELFKIFGREY